MAWIHYQIEIHGKPASALLDTQFATQAPISQLPNLAWFGLHCQQLPGKGFCHPQEEPKLDAIEYDLIRLCSAFGNGWAVYVRRLDTPGLRKYYVYFGGNAELEKVGDCLRPLHAGYRIEFETRADPNWSHYKSWIQEISGS